MVLAAIMGFGSAAHRRAMCPAPASPGPGRTDETTRGLKRDGTRDTATGRHAMTTNHALQPGTKAPDFALHATPDQRVSLSEFSGRPVVLAFYPADWSPVCGDQMALYNEILEEFEK